MANVIIGIHGLANKPVPETLAAWWKASIVEGLENVGVASPEFDFRMVHWAHYMYSAPLHTREFMEFDPLFNSEPYVPAEPGALREYRDSWLDLLRATAGDLLGTTVDSLKRHFGMDALADWLLGRLLKDLAFYYDADRRIANAAGQPEQARKVLLDEFKGAVKKAHGEGHRLLVIAHSMGTIIAYDALRDIGREEGNTVEVARLATIGSPLGLPHVKLNVTDERAEKRFEDDTLVRTPTIVTESWTNFADRKDPVAADIHLADDYGPNATGIQVNDDLIANDFFTIQEGERQDGERKHNHHKSYGYLRAPEMARYVRDFLSL